MQDVKRAFEFRAYHTPSGCLFPVLHFTDAEIFRTPHHAYWRDECVLMQFTGLYDSQGRKVFEGDIIYSYYEGDERNPSTEYWRIIAYREGCFCQLQHPDEEATVWNFEPVSCEQDSVVGCHYVRPDLLALNTESAEVPLSFD